MKQTIIISLLIISVGLYLSEKLEAIEQNDKQFHEFLKETIKEQEAVAE